MIDDRKNASQPQHEGPGEATPLENGKSPKPADSAEDSKPAPGAPYDKDKDPAQQPS